LSEKVDSYSSPNAPAPSPPGGFLVKVDKTKFFR
jgi:hypothetical protein